MSFTVDESLLLTCLRRGNPAADEICIKKYECKQRTLKDRSNYTSNVFGIWVEYECDGNLVTEFMVAKVPYLGRMYAYSKASGLYSKEIYMYETVIPKLMDLSPVSVVPKHYFTAESDVLLLEDLTEQGFFLSDQMLWNFERSVLLLKELAKFHAASVKLNREDPAMVKMASRVTFFTDDFMSKSMNCIYPRLVACLQAEKVDPIVLENFASFEQKINEGNIWLISDRVGGFKALVHGNLKANNIFLKNDGDKPISAKIVDYQTCMWNSPALDLLYFYVVTVGYDLYEQHSEAFLDRYLISLNASLLNAECDCTYTKDDYYADVAGSRLYQVFVLLFLGFYDIIDAVPGFHFTNYSEIFSPDEVDIIRLSKKFRCRFLKWFRYFEKQGYFN